MKQSTLTSMLRRVPSVCVLLAGLSSGAALAQMSQVPQGIPTEAAGNHNETAAETANSGNHPVTPIQEGSEKPARDASPVRGHRPHRDASGATGFNNGLYSTGNGSTD